MAGHPVHWLYVLPSDGVDRFSTYASAMQTDAESIDAWWRAQDPTRAPRNDLAQLPCGLQLDLTTLRLPHSGSALAQIGTRFQTISAALASAGFGSPHSKYLLYYDGPTEPYVCGQGGGGYAIVHVQACTGVPTDQVAAHELLHTLGAVADAAPNMCPSPNEHHVCEEPYDVMYPMADSTPLTGLSLDAGRDDYYAHAGAWTDTQDSPCLLTLDRQTPLTVTIAGGEGRVVSDVPGLDCSQTCSTTWNDGTRLVLTASAGPGRKLARWSGACTGAGSCALAVGSGASVTALFAPSKYRLSVRVSGRGSIRSSSPGIACPSKCRSAFSSYEQLKLTATPAKGWKLKRWAGACRGKRLGCVLPMSAGTSARAVFVRA